MHPTPKPVALFLRPLQSHTKADEVAYETFFGSGSQLLACDHLGRLCYAMELATDRRSRSPSWARPSRA